MSSAATSTSTYWSVQDPSGSKLTEGVQQAVETAVEAAANAEQSTKSWLEKLFG